MIGDIAASHKFSCDLIGMESLSGRGEVTRLSILKAPLGKKGMRKIV